MKRQNSIPQPLRPSTSNNHRRKSHDALQYYSNTVSASGGLMTLAPPNHRINTEMLNSILVTDVGSSNAHTMKVCLTLSFLN